MLGEHVSRISKARDLTHRNDAVIGALHLLEAVTGLGGLRLPPPWILSEALTGWIFAVRMAYLGKLLLANALEDV